MRQPALMENADPKVEAFLRSVGVTAWQYVEDVPLDSIAIEDSRKNQARIQEPIDTAAVDRYFQFLRDGARFPPVILWDRPDGKLYVLDGNHRVAAHEKHGTAIDAYIIPRDTPVAIREMIKIAYNGQHGLTLSDSDRVRHALYLRNSGQSAAVAARRMGISVNKLQGAINLENADLRAAELLEDLPTEVWDATKDTNKVVLSTIKTDGAFVAATKLAVAAGMSTAAVKDLVTALRPVGTEKRQVAIVEEWRKTLTDQIAEQATAGEGRSRAGAQPLRVRVKLAIGQVGQLDPARIAALPEREREDVAEAARKGIERLGAVLAAAESGQAPTAAPTAAPSAGAKA
jgi:hypothetical protein